MTPESSHHGASTRTPVVHGGRRLPGLHERVLKDGTVVYEARLRIDGKDRRVVLEATTKFDAVREYENLRADRNRGVEHEHPLLNPTVAETSLNGSPIFSPGSESATTISVSPRRPSSTVVSRAPGSRRRSVSGGSPMLGTATCAK